MSKKFTYRVRRGAHYENGKLHKKGDTFESDTDYLPRNDPRQPRLELAEAVAAPVAAAPKTTEADPLAEMSFAELKAYAAEGDVDISGLTTKAAIINAIKAAE